jgi:hypothetical protein
VAVQFYTDWRDEKAKYGFATLGPALVVVAESSIRNRSLRGRALVLINGFPMAAICLAGLSIDEFVERRKIAKNADADGC